MIQSEPKYVTPDDFENFWGVNLNATLKGNNYSNKANTFLRIVEDRLLDWVDTESFRTTTWDEITDFQLEYLQKAILNQAMYVYKNSDIAMDSGYDPDSGQIVDYSKLYSISVCQPAINCLLKCGLYSHRIRNRRRFTTFD